MCYSVKSVESVNHLDAICTVYIMRPSSQQMMKKDDVCVCFVVIQCLVKNKSVSNSMEQAWKGICNIKSKVMQMIDSENDGLVFLEITLLM